MEIFIEKIEIIGLHDHFDIEHYFLPGINIIYGENGQFKTTLLHILANALNNRFESFLFLNFNNITIHMNDGISVFIQWTSDAREKLIVTRSDKRLSIAEITKNSEALYQSENPLLKAAYFPTFRSTLEAWFSYQIKGLSPTGGQAQVYREEITSFARKIFGEFIPDINFSSLPEVIEHLENKISQAAALTIKEDQELTAKMVSAISEIVIYKNNGASKVSKPKKVKVEEILLDLRKLITEIENHPIEPFLVLPKTIKEKLFSLENDQSDARKNAKTWLSKLSSLYLDLLADELEAIKSNFDEVVLYLKSLNNFLDNKKISISSKSDSFFKPSIKLEFISTDCSKEKPEDLPIKGNIDLESSYSGRAMDINIQNLSSGERQIATLLYAAYVSSQPIILIDEPEISLHVKWQRILLKELQGTFGEKQLIICTHSPMIGAGYREAIKGMTIHSTDSTTWQYNPEVFLFEDDENEDDGDDESDEFSAEESIEDLDIDEDKEYYEDD